MKTKKLAAGATFGRYRIRFALGSGAMAHVYLARDARSGQDVALKILRPHLVDGGEIVERFEREARLIESIRNPYVADIYEVGEEGGIPYIAMEYVRGQTLRELLDDGPLGVRTVCDLSRQLAEGLSNAHEQGVVHRDLKPENVMVTLDGRIKILDFGLSKPLAKASSDDDEMDETFQALTVPGTILGTLEYMAPEQARGERVSFSADQFAFGAIVHEMLSGIPPFRRTTMAATLAAVVYQAPPPIRCVRQSVPPALATVVMRCLEKSPRDRFGSIAEVAAIVSSVGTERPMARLARIVAAAAGLA